MGTAPPSYAKLEGMSDDELKARYDHDAKLTTVGVNFPLEVLRWRYQDRQTRQMLRLTRIVAFFTAVVTLATLVNVAVLLAG